MANTFWRKPIVGGDDGAWGPYNDEQNKDNLGVYTASLYDDSGTLKITTGRIGINDGTNIGVSVIDTVTTISLAGVSNSNWAKIEMTVAGSSVTFAAADIAGATTASSLPAGFTGAYDGEKGGFYISATKRCLGIVWKNAGGTLEGVINTIGSQEGWTGYGQSDDANDVPYIFEQFQGNTGKTQEGMREFAEQFKLTNYGRWPTSYIESSSITEANIFAAIIPYLPNDNDELLVSGAAGLTTTPSVYRLITRIRRVDSTQVAYNYLNINLTTNTISYAGSTWNSVGANTWQVILSW